MYLNEFTLNSVYITGTPYLKWARGRFQMMSVIDWDRIAMLMHIRSNDPECLDEIENRDLKQADDVMKIAKCSDKNLLKPGPMVSLVVKTTINHVTNIYILYICLLRDSLQCSLRYLQNRFKGK